MSPMASWCAGKSLDRVALVGEDRGAHQHDLVAEGAACSVVRTETGIWRHQRLERQVVVLEQPAPDGAAADRDDDVVDGRAVLVPDPSLTRSRDSFLIASRRWGETRPLNEVRGGSTCSRPWTSPPSPSRFWSLQQVWGARSAVPRGWRRRCRPPRCWAAPRAAIPAPAAGTSSVPMIPRTSISSCPGIGAVPLASAAAPRGPWARGSSRTPRISAPDMPSTTAWWILGRARRGAALEAVDQAPTAAGRGRVAGRRSGPPARSAGRR